MTAVIRVETKAERAKMFTENSENANDSKSTKFSLCDKYFNENSLLIDRSSVTLSAECASLYSSLSLLDIT